MLGLKLIYVSQRGPSGEHVRSSIWLSYRSRLSDPLLNSLCISNVHINGLVKDCNISNAPTELDIKAYPDALGMYILFPGT